ncbi:LysR substrate-binding domain-containing protein [Microvirga alba]|uniref:LysR family transcriptional regulator n=1 Tax=Microvirga alba TaxID=2791025 RepID=A0A931FNA5_9HYPH|nr:LysR substrate-binding domain-containing protein [Microvirga alba]MBF9233465.1 LysR family transcriptional regulator [Microvirga alba]
MRIILTDRPSFLPPLQWLRTFEAVARHLSFTQAAAELAVTQSAVSHQVRQLEEQLGCRLFRRKNPGIELTDEGQLLLTGLADGLERMRTAVQRVRTRGQVGTLTVAAPSSFAAWWLVPRLGRFATRHPRIEVRIAAMEELPDFVRDGVDLAIAAQPPSQAMLTATSMPLVREEVFPVCSPALLNADGGFQVEDLKRHALLREDGYPRSGLHPLRPELDWNVWLEHLGLTGVEPYGPQFSHFGLALRAAIDGAGLVLGRSPMVDAELAAGRLVRPFGDIKMLASKTYVALWPKTIANDARVVAMREFLLDESCGCELAAGPCGIPPSDREHAGG